MMHRPKQVKAEEALGPRTEEAPRSEEKVPIEGSVRGAGERRYEDDRRRRRRKRA
jgi:hypothetical protein